MKNVAYTTIQNNPRIPNGFIIDHYETDDDVVPGYLVVSKEVFSGLLLENVSLMRAHERHQLGIVSADPTQPAHVQRPNHEAEPADVNIITERNKEIQQTQEDMALFKQFMAWKASQGSGS